jgi:ectoine hydroxylase-related dioxygenase (phytanoyl-CoA dioxygenase family)
MKMIREQTDATAFDPRQVEEIAAALHAVGYARIRSAIAPTRIACLLDAIGELLPITGDHIGKGSDRSLYTTVFNRDRRFRDLIDLPGVIDVAETVLGADCHMINQKVWLNPPGCVDGSQLHIDMPIGTMPEDLCCDARYSPPILIIATILYLDDIDVDLCPTMVVPGSHRSGRSPSDGEERWRGQASVPILAQAGDIALFRSDLWHSGSANRTSDRTRRVIDTSYGRRVMAQKFYPYLNFRHDESLLAEANPRQRRLLGEHQVSSYG